MQKIFGHFLTGRPAIGLLILRVIAGGALMQHGQGKMFGEAGPFNWMGPNMPGFLQFLAALAEFGGGLAIIFGFLTPLACFGVACTMAVAILKAHAGDAWVASGPGQKSWELAGSYLAVALMLIFTGPGRISLDALIFDRNKPVSPDRLNRAADTSI